jgi:DNA-binding response OmpR family regulator
MKKILVIEDFDRLRELLDIFLTKAGFSVTTTGSGKEGIAMAQREKPEAILIDFTLKDESGLDVLRKIRAFDTTSKIYIISGLYDEDLKKESYENGATGFISKGSGIEGIVGAVTDALS